MDEYEGFFRIATTVNGLWSSQTPSSNDLYVYDPNGALAGHLTGLGKGELMMAVRFQGPKATIVTYLQTDPLFVVDLEDPYHPVLMGELQVPGFSQYLFPINDTYLIGVGQDANNALKLALFDISIMSQPMQVCNLTIGDRFTSSLVFTDPKAFLYDPIHNIVVLPVSLYLGAPWPSLVFDGVFVIGIESQGFVIQANITHYPPGTDLSAYSLITSFRLQIVRSLFIGQRLFTVSNNLLKGQIIGNWTETPETLHLVRL